MILNKALLLKGLGGVTAIGSVGGVYIYWEEIKRSIQGKTSATLLLERAGLSCNNNDSCTLAEEKKLTIKHDDANAREITSLAATGSSGKVKLYSETDYNEGLKFVIEGGDISFNGSGGSPTKLEQFETYELKEEDDSATQGSKKYILLRKKKASDEIKRLLGLPTDNCNLPTTVDSQEECCDITGEKLKAIKFEGRTDTTSAITVTGSPKLKITKTSDTTYPLGYKFVFETTEELTISSNPSIKIAKNSNTEFKIKVTKSSGTTPVKLSLEKAWTAKSLGEKVGLNCPEPSGGGEKKCTFTDGSINVKNDNENSKITNGKFKNSNDDSNKKMTYEEDKEGYNQGFKFYLDESDDLSLTNSSGSDDSSEEKKICKKGDANTAVSYEIKEDSATWYLTKKANAQQSA